LEIIKQLKSGRVMKVIHTYASYKPIWKERLYVQMLSAL